MEPSKRTACTFTFCLNLGITPVKGEKKEGGGERGGGEGALKKSGNTECATSPQGIQMLIYHFRGGKEGKGKEGGRKGPRRPTRS